MDYGGVLVSSSQLDEGDIVDGSSSREGVLMYAFSFCCAHVDNGDMMDRYQYLRDRYFIDRSPAHGNLENCGNGDSDVSSKTDPSHLSRLSHPFPIYFYFL